MDADAYAATAVTRPARHRERACYNREIVHAVLDEALICHLGYIRDGRPVVLPTIHARIGERLYLHGSTGATVALRAAGEGIAVCVTATVVDGLVLARSGFQHSMNYRSVVVHGTARPVVDEQERRRALDAVVNHVWPGRAASCRAPSVKELQATSVLAVDLLEVSAKCRSGEPADKPEDIDGPWWAGIVPVQTAFGAPRPVPGLPDGVQAPGPRSEL